MTADNPSEAKSRRVGLRTRIARIIAKPGFQRWAARFPLTRGVARREGEALFDLVQGFVSSQVLFAIVRLELIHRLMDGPMTVGQLAQGSGVPVERMQRLVQAGAALGLMRRRGDLFSVTQKGAALIGVPGLQQMILHHDVLYRDLSDPVEFLKGNKETELAGFWPYVFGAEGATDPETTAVYSDLMAKSQGLVAQDTLRAIKLDGIQMMLDVGSGSGAFAEAAATAYPDLKVTLFDLPKVVDAASTRLSNSAVKDRIEASAGSFRDDPLPQGAEAISLIRVLYDHEDTTVVALLEAAFGTLPSGGRIIISEPMSGGQTPEKSGDVYFAFYCMAMRTGTVRSQNRIAELLKTTGFSDVQTPKSARPFVTSVVTATKP
ncbi:methyltransferase [Thalassococcus lentus]|uniref:Methyltransferase n=2 Tax=Thalassococcus lentus TaxID=1210524 RepID=A0ABT4XN68_9RHOB|nr:methyltransferase [Thalassococcus lentus]MDA7423380.1 methyltransferase [Thalassococcus lentus]